MRRFFLLAGAGVALFAGEVVGQQMPGQFTGKPLLGPVGTQLPQVGTQVPKVGTPPPGYGGLTGTGGYAPPTSLVDPKLVAAPSPSLMPAQGPKSFWDSLYDRWRGMFGLNTPTPVQRNWTPGIGRRNKERKDGLWVRD